MAFQGRGPGRKPNGASSILEGDEDILTTRNIVYGFDEGTFASLLGSLHFLTD